MRMAKRLYCALGSLVLLGVFPAQAETAAAQRPAFVLPANSGIPVDYRSRWKQLSKPAVSGMHWQQLVVVYSNDQGKAYQANQDAWWAQQQASGWGEDEGGGKFQNYRVGTVLLKEAFTKGKPEGTLKPAFLAIMVKHQPGYDPKHGDWEFIQSTPQGKVLLRGPYSSPTASAICGNCHLNAAEKDFVFATSGLGSR